MNPPFLVVTNADLWPRFEHHFAGADERVHLVSSLEIDHVEQVLAWLPEIKAVIGIGGGVAIDIARYLAWRRNLPLFQVPTSMSVIAPFAHRAAVRDKAILKYVGFHVPEMVSVDDDVIQSARVHQPLGCR